MDRIDQLEIIVSRCTKANDERGAIVFGSQFKTTVLVINGQRARAEQSSQNNMKPWCREGFCVVVRPSYNNDDGSFHEYRSFNGEEFTRVDFRFGDDFDSVEG